MTISPNRSRHAGSDASKASILHRLAVRSGRQDSRSGLPSSLRVRGRILRAFHSRLVQPLKTWKRLEQEDVPRLHGPDDRRLRTAISTGAYEHAPRDNAERIAFRPEAGKPERQTPAELRAGERTVRWDERPPQIII
jgi:hypothetical protein